MNILNYVEYVAGVRDLLRKPYIGSSTESISSKMMELD